MINPKKWKGHLACPMLAQLTAAEWCRRLQRLDEPVRSAVGSIVFWDYADRARDPKSFRLLFDDMLCAAIEVTVDDLEMRRGLREVGYSQRIIDLRLPVTTYVRTNLRGRPRTGRRLHATA